MLIECGVDCIEVSEKVYSMIKPLPEGVKYALRVKNAADLPGIPEFSRMICRHPYSDLPGVTVEVPVNDMSDSYTLSKYADFSSVRIKGLDGVLLGDYTAAFKQLNRTMKGALEICPGNSQYCATAIAMEWASCGGSDIVASFGGIGGFAALEEVVMGLRVTRQRKSGKHYAMFPLMRMLIQEITKYRFPRSKPVIGEGIFCVESGIHVDGISKQPKCYEPFPPDVVGQVRTVVLGKHSGKASVLIKLKELGFEMDSALAPELLLEVKDLSIKKNAPISSDEFLALARKISST
jgi:homocitrate synthase NifV